MCVVYVRSRVCFCVCIGVIDLRARLCVGVCALAVVLRKHKHLSRVLHLCACSGGLASVSTAANAAGFRRRSSPRAKRRTTSHRNSRHRRRSNSRHRSNISSRRRHQRVASVLIRRATSNRTQVRIREARQHNSVCFACFSFCV